MQKKEILEILSEIFEESLVRDDYIDVPIEDPVDDENTSFMRYREMEDGSVQVEKRIDDESCDLAVRKDLRDIIWKKCKLEKICRIYEQQYDMWRTDNNSVPYIETKIIDEADGSSERAFTFMKNFGQGKPDKDSDSNGNLRLLLAEYGVGKSSFCHGIRSFAAKEMKSLFLREKAAFPFVFDLNNFRTGDFDKFIETELFGKYHLPMVYRVFEKLCQNGIFMVVLDAWDQMKDTRKVLDIRQDLNQMSSLWEKKGRVLITCRRSFYQQQLKEKGRLSQDVRLYNLLGFDKDSVIDYLQRYGEEQQLEGVQPLLGNEEEWVEECWQLNNELLTKPLNLRLLVKHFDVINEKICFKTQQINTYQFLEIVLQDWVRKNNVTDVAFLKELVSQTLFSGLNRSIPLKQFKEACEESGWKRIYEAVKNFDFVKIDDREERIEFCLAAFQEFLWAHFALDELQTEPEKLKNESALIRNYLLIREVREWICMVLGSTESACLEKQIFHVKNKKKEDVGYCGSNALTLLCDLNRIQFYKNQFKDIKKDLRRRPLMGTDFRGMDLSEADFYGSNLEGSDFSYTNLNGAKFINVDLADTTWREHGRMRKCAFLNRSDVRCLVTSTENGGVLTYQIDNGEQEVLNLQNDVINDLAGDRGGIYTASSDGWVGYIDKYGNLRNAYIAQSGLQSIARTRNESCVYVGADNQEIYRYNWGSGSKQQIEVDQTLGDENDRISDIHYYSDGKDDYVAYTLDSRKLLVLLRLTGMCRGEVIAKGRITSRELKFGDICFADETLIYSVEGKGIFGMLVEEAIGEIPEEELLNEHQKLLPLPGAKSFSLSWANEKKRLFAVAKTEGQEIKNIYALDMVSEPVDSGLIELNWEYEKNNYCLTDDKMEGFSVSDDGEYLAFSGRSLAVLHNMGGNYYELSAVPIEAKVTCKNADFSCCTGVYKKLREFWESRGANKQQEEKDE